MNSFIPLLLLALILSLPKVPHLVRWGFGKDRLKYIRDLKARGQYEEWKAKNKYFLLAENTCTAGIIIGLALAIILWYFKFTNSSVFLLIGIFFGIAGLIVSLALDSKIPPRE